MQLQGRRPAARLINNTIMALRGRLSPISLLSGFLLAALVAAQTETIYLTQISTVFTAYQCSGTSPLGLMVSLSRVFLIHLKVYADCQVKATPVYA